MGWHLKGPHYVPMMQALGQLRNGAAARSWWEGKTSFMGKADTGITCTKEGCCLHLAIYLVILSLPHCPALSLSGPFLSSFSSLVVHVEGFAFNFQDTLSFPAGFVTV